MGMRKDSVLLPCLAATVICLLLVLLAAFAALWADLSKVRAEKAACETRLKKVTDMIGPDNGFLISGLRYDTEIKRYVIPIHFEGRSTTIPDVQGLKLLGAGRELVRFLNKAKGRKANYMIVIEGQGGSPESYELSYWRAVIIRDFWRKHVDGFEAHLPDVIVTHGWRPNSVLKIVPVLDKSALEENL